jgi:small-conductance mechanosensitive channel
MSQSSPSTHELAQQFLSTGVMAGGVNTKESAEDQATKAVTSAETLKLLETASTPENNHPVKQPSKQAEKDSSLQTQLSLSPNEWWAALQQLVSRDNIIFAIKATLRIIIILLIYMFLRGLINHFVTYYTQKIPLLHKDKNTQSTTVAIIKTVSPIIRSTIHWVLVILAGLLILSELNINIMPIIYSFSVIGLAISIGSQTLVKDLINGVMTLFEGNIAVGDVVTIGAFKGEVESISLRCVYLRHGTGELQTIPFSEVNNVINHSRDYGVADIQFPVAYQADLKEVERALQTTYEQIRHDKDYTGYIKGELKPLKVSQLDEWGIKVHASIKTIPDPSNLFLEEFYRLLISELQSHNIPMVLSPVVSIDTKGPKLV